MLGVRRLLGGVAIVVGFGVAAEADRYRVHKDAGNSGICITQSNSYYCQGDIADKAVFISADEVDALVKGARSSCDQQASDLRARLRELGDANDALAKRVSELETKLAAMSKPAPVKPAPKK